MMKSSLPSTAETVPAFAVKPDWKTTQASTFLKRAIFSSSSMWIFMVPAMVRTAPEPIGLPQVPPVVRSREAKRGIQVVLRPVIHRGGHRDLVERFAVGQAQH